jgi:hypothetical protein
MTGLVEVRKFVQDLDFILKEHKHKIEDVSLRIGLDDSKIKDYLIQGADGEKITEIDTYDDNNSQGIEIRHANRCIIDVETPVSITSVLINYKPIKSCYLKHFEDQLKVDTFKKNCQEYNDGIVELDLAKNSMRVIRRSWCEYSVANNDCIVKAFEGIAEKIIALGKEQGFNIVEENDNKGIFCEF